MTFRFFTEYSRLQSVNLRLNQPLAESAALLTITLRRTSMAKRGRTSVLDTYALLWLIARIDGAIMSLSDRRLVVLAIKEALMLIDRFQTIERQQLSNSLSYTRTLVLLV